MTTIDVNGVRVPAIGYGTWLVTGQDATCHARDSRETNGVELRESRRASLGSLIALVSTPASQNAGAAVGNSWG
jgi:hypothetical protein